MFEGPSESVRPEKGGKDVRVDGDEGRRGEVEEGRGEVKGRRYRCPARSAHSCLPSSTAPHGEKGPEWRADPFQHGNPTHTKL